jgi:D-glycero-D-manno-heptose 1,7-bisphosphate phosphatase
MNRKGYRVLVLTNQSCIGRGELSWQELRRIHALMQRRINAAGGSIDAIYVCPHVEDDDCDCRKPKPGLVRQARLQHEFKPVDTWMVGDAQRDIEAATNAGCRPALVRTGKGAAVKSGRDMAVFDDLAHFARNLSNSEDPA